MKCAILSLIVTMTLMAYTPMMALACHDAPGGQQDAGDSESGSTGSSGNDGSDTSNDAGRSNTSSATSDRDGNSPINFRFIECSNPLWRDFKPCFERMVREREAFVSKPGKED